jgi:hypothetical protein
MGKPRKPPPEVDDRQGDGNEVAVDPKAPPDVQAKSLRDLARLLGVHYNTLSNWKGRGVEPVESAPPYSLKAFCLLLRPAHKLPECHPTVPKVRAIWQWAFGASDGGSINPDDPAHGPTQGWNEEDKRQAALAKLEVRRQERMKTDTLAGRLKDDAEVRASLRELLGFVTGELSSVQTVANLVRGLTPTQRADLGDALMEWQSTARTRIAELARKYAKATEATRVDAG